MRVVVSADYIPKHVVSSVDKLSVRLFAGLMTLDRRPPISASHKSLVHA